jgi:hypothetical protein
MLALEQNGYTGLWEVSTQAAANQADKMLSSLGGLSKTQFEEIESGRCVEGI